MEFDEFTVELDEFASIRDLSNTPKLPEMNSGYYRQRSYSKEDVKIGSNVLLNSGTISPEFVISDEGEDALEHLN